MNSEDAHIAQTYPQRGLSIVRGSGAVLYDSDGKEYIDCMTGIGVALLGHSHPAVVSAIKKQAEKITTCNCMFYNETRERFVEKVAGITPGNLNRMFLCNSGAESVECALKLARKHTGKTGFVAMNRAFHGRTMGALSATWKPAYKKPFEPLVPGFSHIPFGDIEALRNAVNENTAAVLLEPVQGESGVLLPPEGYLQEVREICNENNILMILDEVQTFGRTGNFFASQTFDVVPDIVCTAKGIGGGVPLGVTSSTDEIFSAFGKGDHFTTFSGNPLSCAAGLATIETIQNENLLQVGAGVGEYLASKLRKIENPAVRDVRSIGAMAAMEMRFPVGNILKACQDRGVIIHVSGKNIMRFLPPLVMTREQVDKVVQTLQEVLNENLGA